MGISMIPDLTAAITDTIFVVWRLQEKYLTANKRLLAFVDLEKAFYRVPRKVIWWALWKLSVEEWIMQLVQGMYANAQSCVCVGEGYRQWKVWSEGRCSLRLGTQPAALHHCAWSLVTWVPFWGPLGGPLCQWPCYHSWIAQAMCQGALDLEKSNGGERTESKSRKDHDL